MPSGKLHKRTRRLRRTDPLASGLQQVLEMAAGPRAIACDAIDLTRPQLSCRWLPRWRRGRNSSPAKLSACDRPCVTAETGGGVVHHGELPLLRKPSASQWRADAVLRTMARDDQLTARGTGAIARQMTSSE